MTKRVITTMVTTVNKAVLDPSVRKAINKSALLLTEVANNIDIKITLYEDNSLSVERA